MDQGGRSITREMELDTGIWSDLREVHEMVSISMPCMPAERSLFNDLCERFAPQNANTVSDLTYRGLQLRDGSILTLSSSIIWTAEERYHIVRKLGEYRNFDISEYERLVTDDPSQGPTIPNVDWYSRLQNAAAGSVEGKLYNVYKHGGKKTQARKARQYQESESIRYFLRCVYEHIKISNCDIRDVSDLIYTVYPEAPSCLYRMLVDIFFHQIRGPATLPPVVSFFWTGPYHFK